MSKKTLLTIAGVIAVVAAAGAFIIADSPRRGLAPAETRQDMPVISKDKLIVAPELTRPQAPEAGVEIVSEKLAEDYSRLTLAAKNSPEYSYKLALALLECSRVQDSYESIDEVNESGALRASVTERMLDSADATANRCAGLSADQLESYASLVDSAAESGLVSAQLGYSDLLAGDILSSESIAHPEKIVEYKRKSIDYWKRAALVGESEALLRLGLAYQDGILVSKNPSAAYMYLHAYGISHPGSRVNVLKGQAANNLSGIQKANSAKLGQALYDRCCRN